MTDDETAGPILSQAAEGGLLLVDGRHVPAFRGESFRDRRAHPAAADNDELHTLSVARGSTFLSRSVPFEDALGEGDDQHLAGCLLEDIVDGGREEARLAAPPRGRAEDDQVGALLV